MQEIQVTRAIILTPSSLVSTKSHHSVTNVRGDMQILAITVGHKDIYYNVGLYVSSTWGVNYTNFNVLHALQQGAGIHYLERGEFF